MKKSSKKKDLPAEDYANYISGIQLLGVSVLSFSGQVIDRKKLWEQKDNLPANFKGHATFYNQFDETNKRNITTAIQSIECTVGEHEPLIHLLVNFEFVYGVPTPMTQEIFDEFQQSSLIIQAAPYIREWIASQCSRLNAPIILFPLVISG